MKPVLIYCFDAYCSWCYGFSPVIKKAAEKYKDVVEQEVIPGGMILPEIATPIEAIAPAYHQSYKTVEETAGVQFGSDFLWHINNPDQSDWFPNSEKAAIAICVFKEFYPDHQIQFAHDLQKSLFSEGRDLTDNEAYRHLLERFAIHPEVFFKRLNSEEYKEKAYYEFQLVKQLQVTGFPTVFVQTGDLKFQMVARGFTDFETLTTRIDNVLAAL